jgi:hypothetical protein
MASFASGGIPLDPLQNTVRTATDTQFRIGQVKLLATVTAFESALRQFSGVQMIKPSGARSPGRSVDGQK